jgi:hypothetical protein
MRNLFTLLLVFSSLIAVAQTEISATVVDTTGTTLPGANAVLLRSSDSLLTAFGTTDGKGEFLMQNVKPGEYLLRVTFLGFERPDQKLNITEEDQFLGLGELKMYPAGFFLDGVEVTADRIPIRMKGDTMMYDAEAFAVGENAVVEDLLRRLPGMSVDANGQITWRGRPVNEVLINGKPFFAGNSTLLTQNLDAKAVQNVEVFDQQTDAEEVSGVDDGQDNTTINLEMKDEFKAKVFGDLYAGYGTQDRYQAGGKGFRISDVSQLGILGTINNINRVGFSGDEISEFNGNSGRGRFTRFGGDGNLPVSSGDAAGQNRSLAAGLNYGRSIGKNGQLTADYALFDRTQAQQATTREAFTRADDKRNTETVQTNATESFSHRVGFEYRQKVDSVGRIRVNGSAFLTGGANNSLANTIITGQDFTEDYTVDQRTNNERPGGDIRASYNTRVGKEEGRTFQASVDGSYNETINDLNLTTTGLGEELAIPGALANGQQFQDQLTKNTSLGGRLNFTEPLSEKWRLSMTGNYEIDQNEGDYDFRLDEDETENLLTRTWEGYTGTVSLVHPFGRGNNFSFGTGYQSKELGLEGDVMRNQRFNYLLPNARLRLRLKKGFFGTNFNTSVNAPSVNQLQTIAQPGSTGRVTIGNAELEPAVRHTLRTFLWFNDQYRAISANANLSATYTDNAFGNSVTFTRGQQIYQTVNVSHAWTGNAFFGSTIGMNFINGEFRVDANIIGSRGQGFVDGESQTNISTTASLGGNITSELNEDSFIKLGYTFTTNRNAFSDDSAPVIETITHDLLAQFELEVNPRWRLETRFLYRFFEDAGFTGSTDIPDLRAAFEVRPFKKARHYFRIAAFDLLDQNTVINRTAQAFVNSETTSDALGRYFLCTFYYRL